MLEAGDNVVTNDDAADAVRPAARRARRADPPCRLSRPAGGRRSCSSSSRPTSAWPSSSSGSSRATASRPDGYAVLSAIGAFGPLTLTELASMLGMPLTTASDVVRRLEGRGAARRRPNPADGRSQLLELTAGGRRASGTRAGRRCSASTPLRGARRRRRRSATRSSGSTTRLRPRSPTISTNSEYLLRSRTIVPRRCSSPLAVLRRHGRERRGRGRRPWSRKIPVAGGLAAVRGGGGRRLRLGEPVRLADLLRIDPKTNTVVGRTRIGYGACGLGYGAGSLWIEDTYDSTVSRVSARDRQAHRGDPRRLAALRRDVRLRLRLGDGLGRRRPRAHRPGEQPRREADRRPAAAPTASSARSARSGSPARRAGVVRVDPTTNRIVAADPGRERVVDGRLRRRRLDRDGDRHARPHRPEDEPRRRDDRASPRRPSATRPSSAARSGCR